MDTSIDLDDNEMEDLRQPRLTPTEEERVYLKPAANVAYKLVRNEAVDEFKRVMNNEKNWEPVEYENDVVVERWTGTLRHCDNGLHMYRLKGKLDIDKKRFVQMHADFTSRKWDLLYTSVKVVEEIGKTIQVVQYTCKGKIQFAVVSHGDDWVIQQNIDCHRFCTNVKTSTNKGWIATYIENNVGLVVVCLPYETSLLFETPYTFTMNVLQKRFGVINDVNKNWCHYYC